MKMRWMTRLFLLLLGAVPAGAQVVSGRVEGDRGPVPHAVVTIAAMDGTEVVSTLADMGGRFTMRLPVGGTYRMRVIGDEHRPMSFTIRVADGGTYTRRIQLQYNSSSYHPRMNDAPGARARRAPDQNKPQRGNGGGGREPRSRDN